MLEWQRWRSKVKMNRPELVCVQRSPSFPEGHSEAMWQLNWEPPFSRNARHMWPQWFWNDITDIWSDCPKMFRRKLVHTVVVPSHAHRHAQAHTTLLNSTLLREKSDCLNSKDALRRLFRFSFQPTLMLLQVHCPLLTIVSNPFQLCL